MKFSAAFICISMICVLDVFAQRISDLPGAKTGRPSNQTTVQPSNQTSSQPNNPTTAQQANQTSVLFEKTTHDYGTMAQGANGNCEFKFTNTGKAPLTLSNVTASCGCTVPDWPRGPILPGKTSSIKVKYNTAIVGVFNKSITVNSNAATNPVVLQVKGDVTAPNQPTQAQNTTPMATAPPVNAAPPVKAAPGTQDSIKFEKTTHDYGTMVQGADGNCEFKFTNNGKAPLVLSNVAASCGCTVPEWPKAPILPGQAGSIKVKYNTDLVGVFNKSVTVHSNAANSQAILQIKGNVTAKQ